MENSSDDQPLGPRPAVVPSPRESMSRARATVFDALAAAADGTLTQLADRTGLHENTVREHLAGLVRDGFVTRSAPPASGRRGRPAWRYRATPAARSPVAEYAGLATTLAATIDRTSPHPVDDAVAAGVDWGRELARSERHSTDQGNAGYQAASHAVIAVFDAMGFAPRIHDAAANADTVPLTRCPILDAARQYPDIVCGVHLGIAKGVLREEGADESGVVLVPFAEPGACLLHLTDLAPRR